MTLHVHVRLWHTIFLRLSRRIQVGQGPPLLIACNSFLVSPDYHTLQIIMVTVGRALA